MIWLCARGREITSHEIDWNGEICHVDKSAFWRSDRRCVLLFCRWPTPTHTPFPWKEGFFEFRRFTIFFRNQLQLLASVCFLKKTQQKNNNLITSPTYAVSFRDKGNQKKHLRMNRNMTLASKFVFLESLYT